MRAENARRWATIVGIDLFTFEHVGVEGTHAPRLVDADGAIPDGGVTVVTGPSGAGKSTLLRLCNRLDVPNRGCVRFRGDDVAHLDPLALRRRVGMIFQRPTPFGGTVRDNLAIAESTATSETMTRALGRAGLDPSFLDRRAHELSGGEAQRMCLARTLVTEPEVLLMDEPTGSLDEENAVLIERLACDLARGGVPVVWVTHDRAQLERIGDSVLEMRGGRIDRSPDGEESDRDL
jgi:putative ABC transport system ATP-binding protein